MGIENDIYSEVYLTVRPSEVDSYKVVHHSVYYNWYELGWSEYIRKYYKKNPVNFKPGYMEMKYINPLTIGDEICVITTLSDYSKETKEMTFNQTVKNVKTNKVTNKAKVVLNIDE